VKLLIITTISVLLLLAACTKSPVTPEPETAPQNAVNEADQEAQAFVQEEQIQKLPNVPQSPPAASKELSVTPEETVKKWYQAQFAGDWKMLFELTIGMGGAEYTTSCQQKLREFMEPGLVGKTLVTLSAALDPEPCAFAPPNAECKTVNYSLEAMSQGIKESAKSSVEVMKAGDTWKVIVAC